ncbi:MAG: hypothetical protein ACOX2T_08375 [bacterium]
MVLSPKYQLCFATPPPVVIKTVYLDYQSQLLRPRFDSKSDPSIYSLLKGLDKESFKAFPISVQKQGKQNKTVLMEALSTDAEPNTEKEKLYVNPDNPG